jgi:hypothetical protein
MGLLDFVLDRVPRDTNLFVRGKSARAALAFVHIPKTAGTWFSHFLAQHFPLAEIAPPLHGLANTTNFSDPSKRLFMGHFWSAKIDTKRPMRLMTFLRDPLQRTASQYRSWHNKANFTDIWRATASDQAVKTMEWVHQASYEDFIRSNNPIIENNIRDIQTLFLTSFPDRSHPFYLKSAIKNLKKRFFFVGLQEFSTDSLQLFKYQTGSLLEPDMPARNLSEPYDMTLSAAGKARLLQLIQNDLMLYEAGQRLFRRRLVQMHERLKSAA